MRDSVESPCGEWEASRAGADDGNAIREAVGVCGSDSGLESRRSRIGEHCAAAGSSREVQRRPPAARAKVEQRIAWAET